MWVVIIEVGPGAARFRAATSIRSPCPYPYLCCEMGHVMHLPDGHMRSRGQYRYTCFFEVTNIDVDWLLSQFIYAENEHCRSEHYE